MASLIFGVGAFTYEKIRVHREKKKQKKQDIYDQRYADLQDEQRRGRTRVSNITEATRSPSAEEALRRRRSEEEQQAPPPRYEEVVRGDRPTQQVQGRLGT
ncbi:MAG: hypothetical protein M1825_004636 [Sarcosagium campestre]|nr:MAG: hypothetical protein M1825_004636 [Sarcosagium campestre]